MMKQGTASFQGVLRKLEAWQNTKVESCERRAKRYPVRCDARLIGEASSVVDAGELDVQIRDISRSGAGLLCCSPIETGTCWRLQPTIDGLTLAGMTVFCRHCRKVEEGFYLVGVEFGIEAAVMISLGVSAAELHRDECGDVSESFNDGQFVDPSMLVDEDAA